VWERGRENGVGRVGCLRRLNREGHDNINHCLTWKSSKNSPHNVGDELQEIYRLQTKRVTVGKKNDETNYTLWASLELWLGFKQNPLIS
jgi:hypothetical protein